MKLKKFEHFEDTFLTDLIDFTETNLAYLLDDSKYKVDVMLDQQFESVYKIILKTNMSIKNINPDITWINIKDHILQFFSILKINYKLQNAPIWMVHNSVDKNYIAILTDTWYAFNEDQLEYIDIGYLQAIIFFIKR